MTAPYDETFDGDGRLRPAYAALGRRLGRDPLRPPPDVVERLRDRPLGDDARVLPVPLALDDAEYRSVIQPGVAQRARALQAFFAEAVLGGGGGLDPPLLAEILASEGTSPDALRRPWRGRAAGDVRFVYGPDLARGPDGRWMVLEDNVGCVGGAADSFFMLDAYARACGLPPCRPDLVAALRLAAGESVVAVPGCDLAADDPWAPRLRESERRRRLVEGAGIPVVDGSELDAMPAVRLVANFHALPDAVFARGLGLLNAPGTGVLGSKALLPHVPDMIRRHLGEEPLLGTPPTRALRDGTLPADAERWVVKTAAGRGGTGVFVLAELSEDRLAAVRQLLAGSWPRRGAVAQRLVEPSRVCPGGPGAWDGYRVELRPVAYVLGARGVYVSEHASGRAVPAFAGRRQANVSGGACYVPVTREACRPAA